MLVSISKFYQEVTGAQTGSHGTTIPALKRWGVPVPDQPGRKAVIDVSFLPQAKEAWAKEQIELAERRGARSSTGNGSTPLRKGTAHDISMIKELLHAQSQAIGRVEETLNKILAEAARRQVKK